MMPNPHQNQDDLTAGLSRRPKLNVIGNSPRSEELSVFNTPSAPAAMFPAARQFEVPNVEGTVGADVPAADVQLYGSGFGALLSDAPLGPRRKPMLTPGLRASLLTELREISGQVNRMMSQVDRAIHRLGEHAGEPLRR